MSTISVMKSTVSGLQRSVGIGGSITFLFLLCLGFPIYLSLNPDGTLATFVVDPLAAELVILAAFFAATGLIRHIAARAGQVVALCVFGLIILAGADVDSLTGLLIIGVGVILAAQYGYFRAFSRLKIGAVALALLIALLIQAARYWAAAGVSQTILAFLYNATAVLGLLTAYIIVWRDATTEIASRQAQLEAAVQERTSELSREMAARLAAEQASRKAASRAEQLASERLSLLQEVHHRARNSLQMTLTLLDAMDASSPESHDMTVDRVRAIGLVYDLVDSSEDLSSISMEDYLESLVAHLRMAETASTLQIWFQPTASIRSRLEPTVNLGLMVIEIIRVAKLTLTENDNTIVVAEALSDESVVIEVSHGGRPVPPDIDDGSGDAATRSLFAAFVQRLHVDLTINRDELNTWSLRIPLNVLTFSGSGT